MIPEIESLAERGEFLDQPLRVYSSGMNARLAFAVATAVRPELLIVDEVLSVGDSYFQHKSFARIREFREQGASILLVTHALSDVRTLCDRVILLDKGAVLKDGLPDAVVDFYSALIAEKENANLSVKQRRQKDGWILTKSGTGETTLTDLRLTDAASNQEVRLVRVGQRVVLTATVSIHADIPRLVLGYMLRDRMGHVVWGSNTWHTKQILEELRIGQVVEFKLPFICTLGPGSYSFSPALVSTDTHLVNNYEWIDNALVFDVFNADKHVFIGTNWLDAVFDIERRGE